MAPYTVSPNNWSQDVERAIATDVGKGKNSARYQVALNGQTDPASGCGKNFTTAYSCGSVQKTASLDAEALGKYVTYDCSQEAATCFENRVTLEDNGNITSTDGAGTVRWQSGPAAGIADAVVTEAFKAINTPLRRNYLSQGETIQQGQILGSTGGTCALRIDPAKTNTLQVVFNVYDARTIDQKVVGNKNFLGTYSLEGAGTQHVGKVGYVDMNGTLREYPNPMIEYKGTFRSLGNYLTAGTTISQDTGLSLKECEQKCIDASGCAGFNYNPTASNCVLKRADMFPNSTRIIDDNETLYVRDKGVQGDQSCPATFDTVYGGEWEKYPKGREMTPESSCLLGAITREQRTQLANKRKEVDNTGRQLQAQLNSLAAAEKSIDASSKQNRKQLAKDMANYQKIMSKYDSTTVDTASRTGSLVTSAQSTLMERSRVALWGVAGAVSVAAILYFLRRKRTD